MTKTIIKAKFTGLQRISDDTWGKADDMLAARAAFSSWSEVTGISGYIIADWYAFTDGDRTIDVLIRQNLIYSGLAVLAALILFMPPSMAILVTVNVAMIDVSVLGWMYFMGISQNPVSYIVIAMSIGISVDYCAHIGIAFVNSRLTEGANTDHELQPSWFYVRRALEEIGASIFAGGMSTLLGVAVLSLASSETFLTFFKMLFATILFGMIHGFIFFPALLSCLPRFVISHMILPPL